MKLQITIEPIEEAINAWTEDDSFIFATVADTAEEAIKEIKQQLVDYQLNEGRNDKKWANVNIEELEVELVDFYNGTQS